MIKFDHEKVNFANSHRIESNDPQFLTFRNDPTNNTGRTVFSQKIEMYKTVSQNNQEKQTQQTPIRSFKKNNLLKQQNRKGRQFGPIKKLFQGETKDNEIQEPTNDLTINQLQFKNQLLKKKIQKVIKNIKSQQRKQTSLQKEIDQLERQIQEDQKQIESQTTEIQELKSIRDQNQLYLDKLTGNLHEFEDKNNHLETLVDKIQNSLESLLNSSRSEDSKAKMAFKLKEGIARLEILKNEVTNRCSKMQSQVQSLKDFIEHSENLDLSIRDTAYTRETQNNSHFTC